jgi:hypothetical protein
MPEQHTLTATIERAFGDGSPINLESGEFPLTLATQGETGDGNILDIAGVSSAERVPLQIDHSNSALRTLGSITEIRPSRRGSMPVLKGIGHIELDGEGEQAAIRRDVANMIAKGHLTAVSVRASGEKVTDRTDLPTTHPAHVGSGEKNLAKRFGRFFERSTVLEGSIVALGADKRAIIGRSLDAPVSEFWTGFLTDIEDEPEATEEVERDAHDFSQVTDIRSLERLLRDVGASQNESKRIIALCKSESPPRDAERNRKPEQTFSVREVQTMVSDELAGLKVEIARECSELLTSTLGKIQ